MPALAQHEVVAVVHRRAHVAVRSPRPRRAPPRRRAGRAPGRCAGSARWPAPTAAAQRAEQLRLAHGHPLLGAQHLRLVVLELGRDVALGAGQRLAPLVVGGHLRGVGVGDLEVVAEDLVEADLERRDPGALALALLQRGDVLPAAVAERAQLVELAIVAVRGSRRRRPGSAGGRSSSARASSPARSASRSSSSTASASAGRGRPSPLSASATSGRRWKESRSAPSSRGVARPAAARPARRSTSRTPSSASRRRARPRPSWTSDVDGVEPRFDRGRVAQRGEQPLAQEPPAHRRHGAVDRLEQGAPAGAGPERLHQLQVAAGHLVEPEERVGCGARPAGPDAASPAGCSSAR